MSPLSKHISHPTSHPTQLTLDLPTLAPQCVVVVGLSGGMDSVVLLHALHALHALDALQGPRWDFKIHAAHVDYQNTELMPDSKGAQQHCVQLCQQWGIPLHQHSFTLDRQAGKGLEAAARHQRYTFFNTLCERLSAQALLLAHHADDASETVLFNILRGSGIKGLTAFRPYVEWHTRWLCRPLFAYSRSQLHAYAVHHQLVWHEDAFNQDLRFSRNWLRHQLLPKIRERAPDIDARLLALAENAKEAQNLLDDIARQDYASDSRHEFQPESSHESSNESQARVYLRANDSPARKKNLLRYWLHQQGISLPSQRQLNECLAQIARADAMPYPDADRHTHWRIAEFDLYYWRGAVWAVRAVRAVRAMPAVQARCDAMNEAPPINAVLSMNALLSMNAMTEPIFSLDWEGSEGAVYWPPLQQWLLLTPILAWQKLGPIRIRTRETGDQLRVHPHQPRRRLKYLFQAKGVGPWLRKGYPVVVDANNEVIALPNIAVRADLWEVVVARMRANKE